MLAISEANQNGQTNAQSQSQQLLIDSVVAQQKVIAAQRSADTGDATTGDQSDQSDTSRIVKDAASRDTDAREITIEQDDDMAADAKSAEARSVVEAQEAAAVEQTITQAFMARHEFSDLLSVIRDPEDLLIPVNRTSFD